MRPARLPRVKICCIGSAFEAELAIRHGSSAVGLVSAMPSGPGVIPESEIAEIATRIPPGVASVLLTSLQTAQAIIAQQHRCRTNTLQLVDRVDQKVYSALRHALPGIGIVQVIHVTGREALEEAQSLAQYVDALLLDSGNPTAAVKELGGTGRLHDWALSRTIRDTVGVPVYLAGGLTPENVAEAIRTVGPFGLDVCSGVRANGALDEAKLARFFEAVRSATP